jgi:3'-phosphoadenosine 5'-phosphosulfate sulfotransferase (PAPS reductase)/FAD synthetase
MNLRDYDAIILNTSGGKDSSAMLAHVHQLATIQGVTDRLVAVHADLGRAEWAGTKALAARQAWALGIPFRSIARGQDLIDHVAERGMWPSSTTRYCTSDHKRDQIAKVITQIVRELSAGRPIRVLNCMGLRAEESPARAKKAELVRDRRLTNGRRIVDTWLPILDWPVARVWETIEAAGLPHHEAYDLGMPRLSCVFCVFAPKAALVLAGRHNRELLDVYVETEARIGHLFRQDVSMADVRAAVEAGEEPALEAAGAWNM